MALRLVSSVVAVGGGQPAKIGLQVRLEPGWKIYWRSPGDAGVPPVFDWSGSQNLAGADVRWPLPHRFQLFGLETFGYTDEVVLPVRVSPDLAGAPVALRLHLTYGICKEVCIPYEADLALDLPRGPATPSIYSDLIRRYDALVPKRDGSAGLRVVRAALETRDGHASLVVLAHSDRAWTSPDLLIEAPPGYAFAHLRRVAGNNPNEAQFVADLAGKAPADRLAGQDVTVTLADKGDAVERTLAVERSAH
ncbi:MAG TPA: protein-disulfide reductase DsbD domain-containing protein [Candidatus Cybelea sp.]|nr:protein-disulfide reductase DsbD domain-containing protein [Candidatus Cybelea sp.]